MASPLPNSRSYLSNSAMGKSALYFQNNFPITCSQARHMTEATLKPQEIRQILHEIFQSENSHQLKVEDLIYKFNINSVADSHFHELFKTYTLEPSDENLDKLSHSLAKDLNSEKISASNLLLLKQVSKCQRPSSILKMIEARLKWQQDNIFNKTQKFGLSTAAFLTGGNTSVMKTHLNTKSELILNEVKRTQNEPVGVIFSCEMSNQVVTFELKKIKNNYFLTLANCNHNSENPSTGSLITTKKYEIKVAPDTEKELKQLLTKLFDEGFKKNPEALKEIYEELSSKHTTIRELNLPPRPQQQIATCPLRSILELCLYILQTSDKVEEANTLQKIVFETGLEILKARKDPFLKGIKPLPAIKALIPGTILPFKIIDKKSSEYKQGTKESIISHSFLLRRYGNEALKWIIDPLRKTGDTLSSSYKDHLFTIFF